jgi:hypothetical protein
MKRVISQPLSCLLHEIWGSHSSVYCVYCLLICDFIVWRMGMNGLKAPTALVFCTEDEDGKFLWSGTTYQTTWCHIPLDSNLSTQNYWSFGLCPSSAILKTREQCFGNWICFCPEVRGARHLLGWVSSITSVSGWKQIQFSECHVL